MLMKRNFLGRTLFYDKILISQKKVHRIIMVFEEKKFFRKTGLPAKPEYPENHETCQTFFPDSLPKLNSLQVHVKKITFLTLEDFSDSQRSDPFNKKKPKTFTEHIPPPFARHPVTKVPAGANT